MMMMIYVLFCIYTGEVFRPVGCSGKEDVDKAVSAAREAQEGWAALSGFQRGQVLKKAADIIRVIYQHIIESL